MMTRAHSLSVRALIIATTTTSIRVASCVSIHVPNIVVTCFSSLSIWWLRDVTLLPNFSMSLLLSRANARALSRIPRVPNSPRQTRLNCSCPVVSSLFQPDSFG
ncbi:hypothetical protein DFJ58DRAFT_3374 [Suillus subalutaceus]|uniref:uncharacterized protein n=1 Tax=Suillus subalutaceus TaxID=48586 RepID=UPI001B870605|nr:uncharacterized protein DFJ58DRAFT_3374 [Suillus subalutaceus]KAG1877688.1 hypothetical protein DFJ58DRAFT_3374 [Suillus subalutaceus]